MVLWSRNKSCLKHLHKNPFLHFLGQQKDSNENVCYATVLQHVKISVPRRQKKFTIGSKTFKKLHRSFRAIIYLFI